MTDIWARLDAALDHDPTEVREIVASLLDDVERAETELARQAEAHRGEVAALTEALNETREQRDRYRAALATTDAPADLLRALDGQPADGRAEK